MTGNPLVAPTQSSTTWHTGINLLDDASGLSQAISSGSWVDGGLAALGVGLDALTIVINPVGTLISYGLNWLIEHIKPLTDMFDKLAGDADQIAAFAQTWGNVGQAVNQAASDLSDAVARDIASWTGAAADAYRANITNRINSMKAAATTADGIGTSVRMVGEITGAVRMLVRDMITQAIGDFVQDAAEEVFSLGIGTPAVIAQVTEQVADWADKIANVIRKLINSVEKLRPLMTKLEEIWGEVKKVLSSLGHAADDTHLSGEDRGTAVSAAGEPHLATPGESGGTTATSGEESGPSIKSTNPDPSANSKTAEGTDCEGDPVDVTTGVMLQSETDLELPGTLPLVISRTHKSSYRVGRWFGRSWASTLDQKIEIETDAIHFAAADGMLLKFPVPDQTGWVIPDEGTPLRLARTDGGYTVTDRQGGQTLHFAANGTDRLPITAITDRNDNRIDLDYDQHGTLTGLRHSGGYHVRVTVTDGRITAFYLVGKPDTELMRYGYTDGNLTEVINSSGLAERFSYDADGRILGWVDRNGGWYRHTYDTAGRVVRGEGVDGSMSYTFDYDTERRITRATNSLGHTTTYHLNEHRQVIRRVDPLGHATVSEWDLHHRLLSRTDPLRRTTRCEYDEAGNLLRVTRPDGSQAIAEYSTANLPTLVVEPDGGVWRYRYDERGNRIEVSDPTGTLTRYRHNERGQLTGIVNAVGATTQIETNPAGLPVAVTGPTGATTTYRRDEFGRITEQTNPVGGITRYVWTVDGKPTVRTAPDGTTQQWSYDGEGNQTSYTDQLGQVTRTEYGAFDLPAATTTPDGASLVYGYDTELRLVAVTNPLGLVWRYQYDPAGNLTSETDFNGRTLRYGYDPAGQLIQRVNGAGQAVNLVHDALGRVVEETSPQERTRYTYDPLGRLVRASDGDTILALTRDPLGRVLTETCNGRTVTNSYDAVGRRVRRVTPSGVESVWEFDHAGHPTAVRTGVDTLTFTHDAAGRETDRRLNESFALAQTWEPTHQLTSQSLTGGDRHALVGADAARLLRRRDYTYRPDGYLTGITDTLSGARYFDLDPIGRVTGVRTPTGGETYGYDPAGNLTQAVWPVPTQRTADAPERDPLGSRDHTGTLISRAGSIRYQHDPQGRVILRQHKRLSSRDWIWRFTWDTNDRLTDVLTPDGSRWHYRYDPLGRRIAKQHLAANNTILEQIDFVWDGDQLIEESYNNTRVTTWDYLPGSFTPIAQAEKTAPFGQSESDQAWFDQRFYAIVTDLIGTPTELVDTDGGLAWQQHTTLWGALLNHPNNRAATPLRFPGQYHDQETGLYYNYYRYYDPLTARYATPDPLGEEPNPTNHHAYVPNPLTWLDPLGLACKKEAFNQARQDVGIPRSQQPDSVKRVPMEDRRGKKILDDRGQAVNTREYTYTRSNGDQVVIQDHSAGHQYDDSGKGDQGPHFNVRPSNDTRNGKVEGTRPHYPFDR